MQAVIDAAEYRRQISRLALRHFREMPPVANRGRESDRDRVRGRGRYTRYQALPFGTGTKTALRSVPWRCHLRHWGAGQSLERAVTSCGSERHRTEFSAALTSSSSAGP